MKYIIGTVIAALMITPALAEKTYVQLDECMTMDQVEQNVLSNVPDATHIVFGDTVVFTSPSKAGTFTTYFDKNGCYEAYEVINVEG